MFDSADKQYLKLLGDILNHGSTVSTRNSVTKRLTGLTARFDSTPLISVRKTAWKTALREFEWFMSGSSNIKDLDSRVHHWWKPWADEKGFIRNNYSKQFRSFDGELQNTEDQPAWEGINCRTIDQIQYLVDGIKDHPYSRRNVITTWNTAEMADPSTPITNCHGTVIQAFVEPSDNSLELVMYQRSSDMLLGMSHNWIQYWAFLLWLSTEAGRVPGKFTWMGGDCHIYDDHVPLVTEMLNADLTSINTPTLVYKGSKGEAFRADNFMLEGAYTPLSSETARMVV